MAQRQAHRIVVGVGTGAPSAAALRWAATEAAAAGAGLLLVHAEDDPYTCAVLDSAMLPGLDVATRQAEAQRVLAEAEQAARAQQPLLDVRTHTEQGNPVRILIGQASSAAMVVLGNPGGGLLTELVQGAVCGSVAARSPCPVVAVRTAERPQAGRAAIVVGVDCSPVSRHAVAVAFDLAARHRRPLRAVHVMRPGATQATVEERSWQATEVLAEHARRCPEVAVRSVVRFGEPVDVLTQEGGSAHLLVVGSRGYGIAAGLLVRSVSQALLRTADCPTVVVRKDCAPGGVSGVGFEEAR